MRETIEKLLSDNVPIWDYKWIRGNERDRVVAFYVNEYLFSSNVNEILESKNKEAIGILIFNDLLIKDFGYRFFEGSSKSYPFEYMLPGKESSLMKIIDRVAFTIGYNMRNDIGFYEALGIKSHSLEVPVLSQSFDDNSKHFISSFNPKQNTTEEEIPIDDISKVSIAVDYFIEQLADHVELVKYFGSLNDLKSYYAVIKANKVFRSDENREKTSQAIEVYKKNMEEIRSGREFGLEKDFTMNELFLDSMYRLYMEPFEKLRRHGNDIAKESGYIPRMNR